MHAKNKGARKWVEKRHLRAMESTSIPGFRDGVEYTLFNYLSSIHLRVRLYRTMKNRSRFLTAIARRSYVSRLQRPGARRVREGNKKATKRQQQIPLTRSPKAGDRFGMATEKASRRDSSLRSERQRKADPSHRPDSMHRDEFGMTPKTR